MHELSKRISSRQGLYASLSIVVASFTSIACGDAIESRPDRLPGESKSGAFSSETSSGETASSETTPAENPEAPCEEWSTVTCRVQLPSQGGVENCFVGVRTCIDGRYGACHDPAEPPPEVIQ